MTSGCRRNQDLRHGNHQQERGVNDMAMESGNKKKNVPKGSLGFCGGNAEVHSVYLEQRQRTFVNENRQSRFS